MGICGPAALADLDNPIAGYRVIQRTNALDHHCPDPIAWLE